MLKLFCLSVVFFLLQFRALLVIGQECDVARDKHQASPNQPPIRYSTSPVRDSLGLLDGTTVFEDKFFTVNGCVLTLYLKTTLLNLSTFTFDLAGDPVICYKSDGGSDRNQAVVAEGMVLKFQKSSVNRPDVVPPSWYEGERAVLNLTYSTFPKAVEERMTCELAVDVFSIRAKLLTDVNSTAVGCPDSHWGTRCQNVCPCQNGGRCVGTFSARCHCPTGTSGDHCQNVIAEKKLAAAQNSSMPTVSKDGSISSSLVPPVSSTDLTTLGDVNESKPEVSTQVTRHKNDGQANRLFDQCHLPPRTPVAVNFSDKSAIQFSFHPMSVNNRVLDDLRVEDHRYEVRQCQLTIWMRSSPITLTPLTAAVSLLGQRVLCHSNDSSQANAEAIVLYYMGNKTLPRPDLVPAVWYEGTRAVVQLRLLSFPPYPTTSLRMSCRISRSRVKFAVEWGLDIRAEGCPVRKWGTYCQNDCHCQNANNCHTFSGRCLGDPPEVTSSWPESTSRSSARPRSSCFFVPTMFSLLLLLEYK